MKKIIQFFCQEIMNKILHTGSAFRHVLTSQLGFGLRLKYGFHHPNRYGGGNTLSDIRRIVIFFIKIADYFYKCFTERLLMRSSLGRELAVYKAEYLLSVIIVVGNDHFNIVSFQMNYGIAQFVFICTPKH